MPSKNYLESSLETEVWQLLLLHTVMWHILPSQLVFFEKLWAVATW